MTQTYSVAITDGGFGPVNIKINLSFKEALKEALSCLEPRDISRICNLYAISTENHNEALVQIQEIIERHLERDNEYYYHNDSQDNTFIDINIHPEGDLKKTRTNNRKEFTCEKLLHTRDMCHIASFENQQLLPLKVFNYHSYH